MNDSIIKMMTRITYGICPLVYIKPDYIIIFFYNIRIYDIYLLVLPKLGSRGQDSLEVSNTYLAIKHTYRTVSYTIIIAL